MARAHGARAQMALSFETVYGTPPVAGSYWQVPFTTSDLGGSQGLLASEVLGQGRDPSAPIKDAITADGTVGIPLDLRNLGIWLKALFGAPVTTEETGVYTHEFRSGSWTLPSLAIEVGMPDVPNFGMNMGAVANSLTLSMTRAGLITADIALIAQGETVAAASVAGTPEELEFTRFGAFNGEVKRNGTLLGNLVSAQLAYSNNADPVEVLRSDGKIGGVDPGLASFTGNMVVRFADQVLMDQATSGDPAEIEFSYVISATKSLKFTAHAVYLPKPKVPLTGPAGVQATFDWQAARGAAGRMLTVELVNDVADYDNPTP